MDIRRRGCESSIRATPGGVGALLLIWILAAVPAAASEGASAPEPGPGASEAALRERFGASLRAVPVEKRATLAERIGVRAAAPDAGQSPANDSGAQRASGFPGQRRLRRDIGAGDVVFVEYDLHGDRVYRVRQRLAERFERPIASDLATSLRHRLGEPAYDQILEAKPSAGRAELRRIGWERDGQALEVRQIHPLTGGPLYVTRTDLAAARALVDAGVPSLPEPETSIPWWRRPGPTTGRVEVTIPTPEERAELLAALGRLLDAQGW